MKILKNTQKTEVFPAEVKCPHCKSVLMVDREDCDLGALGFYNTTCPVCENKFDVEDGHLENYGVIADKFFENLSVKTIKYPETFYDFSNGVNIENDRINEWVKDIVGELDCGSNYSVISSGNTMVVGFKVDNGFEYDDEEIHVLNGVKVALDNKGNLIVVSKDYGTSEILGGE